MGRVRLELVDERLDVALQPEVQDGLDGLGPLAQYLQKLGVLLRHQLSELVALGLAAAELLRILLHRRLQVVLVVGDARELLEVFVPADDETLGLFVADVEERVVEGSPAFDFVIPFNRLVHPLYLLIGDGVVGVGVGPFEADLREGTLVVAERARAEGNLLDFVRHHHVQYAFGRGFDVVGEGEAAAHVPHLQVVGAACQQVLFLMEHHRTHRHRLVFSAAHQAERRPRLIHSGQPIRVAHGDLAQPVAVQTQNASIDLVLEYGFHHFEVEGLHDPVFPAGY